MKANLGRRKARKLALQALYEADASKHHAAEVCERLLAQASLSQKDAEYVRRLVKGVKDNLAKIDDIIKKRATAWPVEDIATIDRNILRLAIYEIRFNDETPDKVSINEAVELAKLFGAEGSPRFVNGVLGSVVNTPKTDRSQSSS